MQTLKSLIIKDWRFGTIVSLKLLHITGNHWNKGFEAYKFLGELLDNKDFKNQIEFTYIGNLPKDLHLKNTNIISPLNGEALAKELKKNNAYLTGTINEPSGNHHIEASQCGLPVSIDSGGVKEFCQNHGLIHYK